MSVFMSVATIAFLATSLSGGWGANALVKGGRAAVADPLDLDNPIDLEKQLHEQKSSPQSNSNGKLPPQFMVSDSSSPSSIAPPHDPLDEMRRQEMTRQRISSKIAPAEEDKTAIETSNDDGKSVHRWFSGDFPDDRWQGVIEEITSEERRKDVSEVIEQQREYDRRVNMGTKTTTGDYTVRGTTADDGYIPIPIRSWNVNRIDNAQTFGSDTGEMQTHIQREREEEIEREVKKALENKKEFLEKIKLEKNYRRASLSPESRYEEMELERIEPQPISSTSADTYVWRIEDEGRPWVERTHINHDIEKIREEDRRNSLRFTRLQRQWGKQPAPGKDIETRRETDRQGSLGGFTNPWREQTTLSSDVEKRRDYDNRYSLAPVRRRGDETQLINDIERKREEDRRRALGAIRFRRDFMSDRGYWLSNKPNKGTRLHTQVSTGVDIRRPIDVLARERNGGDRLREDLHRRKKEEEERLREIERRRTEEILNQERESRVEVNRKGRQRHYETSKPPILIFEEVAVPVPVKEYDHSGEFHGNRFHSGRPPRIPFQGSKGSANPPPLIISDLYDQRAPDRKHPFLDRRPGRPDRNSQNKVVHVEEGILVHDAILPEGVPLPLGVPAGHIVPVVDPSVAAHLAITSEAAAASEIERLNQAAALADINRLQHLQVADAVIKNQAIAHAVTNQAAFAEAANLGRLKDLQQAVALSSINKLGHVADASRVQAVADQVALTEAAKQQAILSHALLNEQLVSTALREDEVSKSQKIDFINLVLKHGLRKVLQEQLHQHLKTKAQQEAFIHKLQARKEDLIKRLLLLKPYFTSPGRGGFILPAFIPNIPVGAHLSHTQLTQLPKIHLLPSTHLLSPDFHLPHEIATSIQKDVDVGFVEHILRLPEEIFQRVLHIPKKDFILTLFPRLYRETIKHLQIDPEKHYHPNVPHTQVVKEHHHHHIHVHEAPSEKKKPSKYPHYSQTTHHHHHSSTETAHRYPHSHATTSHNVFDKERGKYHWKPQHEAYVDVSQKQHEIILPTSDHKLQNTGHDVHLPLEESSYVSYDPAPFGDHAVHSSSHKPHKSTGIKFTSLPFHQSSDSFQPAGINVRIKGETGHETISSAQSPSLFEQLLPLSDELQGRFASSRQHTDSHELIPFGFRRNDRFPLPELPHTSSSITSPIPFSSSQISITTLKPFSTGAFSTLHPSTIRPRPVRPPFSAPTTPRPFTTASSATHLPSTPRPTFIATTNAPFTTSLVTFETFGGEEVDGNRVIPFTAIDPFRPNEISTLSPINPFRGFTENLHQKTSSEREDGRDEPGKDLERVSGTDSNDDDHVFSAFQKKKGNATNVGKNNLGNPKEEPEIHEERNSSDLESVVNQIRHITNIFGGRSDDDGERTRRERSNFTAPSESFFSNFPDHLDDHVASSIILPPPPPPPTSREKSSSDGDKISILQSVDGVSQLPDIARKKPPTPKRVHPSVFGSGSLVTNVNRPANRQSLSFHSEGFFPKQAGFPFQGGPAAARSIGDGSADEVTGRGHSSFPGISIKELGNIPSFLRESPQCSGDKPVIKSFCLYPKGYESEVAESIVSRNKNEIRRMMQILSKISPPKVDLNIAAKQIPTLDLSATCETENREVQLSWSRDIVGSWFSILQTQPFEQKVTVTTCGDSARAKGCRPLLQPRPFVAFHPEDVTRKPYVMEFPLPVGCVLANSFGESTKAI